jgi:ribulose-5-phosphate 4-epimerase/fuculose-1-phosphate aldolase
MLHLECLKAYDDIHAVIHCHAKYCTMFALTNTPIPCCIEEVEVYVGGDVPVASYQFTGSQELADEVSKWVGDRAAVLMANHGLFVVGRDAGHVLTLAHLVERTAEIVHGAQQLGGIVPLPEQIVEQFSGYYRMGRART